MKITDDTKDYDALVAAVALLESPAVIIKIASLLGKFAESGTKLIPKSVRKPVVELCEYGLKRALDAAVYTMKDTPGEEASTLTHKLLTAVTGALGGSLGWASLVVEVPFTTTVLM